jgi:hypothetical protein
MKRGVFEIFIYIRTRIRYVLSQRRVSDFRTPTTCFILLENDILNEISFIEYHDTRARNHYTKKVYLPF